MLGRSMKEDHGVMDEARRVNTVTNHGCFGCGTHNPIGLRLAFYRVDNQRIRAVFIPGAEHEGYARMTHGGIVSTLLDEAMSWAVTAPGRLAVTARMEVRFRRPVPVGVPVTVDGEVTRDRGRIIEAHAEVRDTAGGLLAEASASFARVSPAQQREWDALYLGSASR